MKSILDKRFRHHKWFKEGVTVRHALDYFAKSNDFHLSKKPSRKQSDKLFDDIIYDNVLTDGRGNYRISQEEMDYYLERKEYWKNQKKIEQQQWLDSEVDLDKELWHLYNNTHYDLSRAEKNLHYWKYEDKNNEVDKIKFWEDVITRVKATRPIVDNMIGKYKDTIKTNGDFREFNKRLDNELLKVVEWTGSGWYLIA